MSNIDNFNRVDDCNKIDPMCINAYVDYHLDPDSDTGLCVETSWGGDCLDLTSIVKAAETCTELYLSPEDAPNCLVYKGECADFCINGDDLSRIISMTKLKDVDQEAQPTAGDVYMFDGEKFVPFNLQEFIDNYNITMNNLNAQINNILRKITPPADAPDNVVIVFGNINLYSDPNVVINEGSGSVTTLDKNHGLYTHLLAENAYGDEIFG